MKERYNWKLRVVIPPKELVFLKEIVACFSCNEMEKFFPTLISYKPWPPYSSLSPEQIEESGEARHLVTLPVVLLWSHCRDRTEWTCLPRSGFRSKSHLLCTEWQVSMSYQPRDALGSTCDLIPFQFVQISIIEVYYLLPAFRNPMRMTTKSLLAH